MKSQTILRQGYLDILFLNRNKAYGGYELRKNYNYRVLLSLAGMTASIIILAVCSRLFHTEDIKPPIIIDEIGKHVFTSVIIQRRIAVPPAAELYPITSVIKSSVPKIVTDFKEQTKVTDMPKENIATGSESTNGTSISKTGNITGNANVNSNKTIGENPGKTDVKKIYSFVEVMPVYNGDMAAYIQKNIHYPQQAKENNIEGKVVIGFVIDEEGNLVNARVVRGIGGGCDEEAIHILQQMSRWQPGKQNGIPVRVYFTVPIQFKLQ
ncbi:MAG: energy transducer TonB [Taibaiella sp.]|nr:energy transducer TonB [Taibaiella sp.]